MSRKKKIKDPFAKREAEKYPNPIPSREYIMDYLRERGKPARRGEIIRDLQLDSEEEQEAIRRRLRAMERDGQVIFTRRGGYVLVEKMDLIQGRVLGHKDGFGFVIPEDGSQDLFLNERYMRLVFDGDRVLVRPIPTGRKGKREAELVEIIERKSNQFVGRFFIENGVAFVTPGNKRISQDILVISDDINKAKSGQYVIVEMTKPPSYRNQAIGHIIEVIGDHLAPGIEIDVMIRSYEIPYQWLPPIKAEIEKLKTISQVDAANRIDLRQKAFVTIDGEDAKDFDDAVYCEPQKRGGWLLYVAIADVSHYVQPNTAIDEEAYYRGNSTYFPGRVIPMLPEILSNELCSLKPNVDRLTLVCEMRISPKGKLTRYRFLEAIIHSHARLTYTKVNKILVEHDETLCKEYQDLIPHLKNLYTVYKTLHDVRRNRGALEFDTVETKIQFDDKGKIKEIIPVERNDAHRLIEECMLLANVSAAKFLIEHNIPGLYRIHEGPGQEKLEAVREFLGELGLSLKGGKKPRTKDYAELLTAINQRDDAHLIQTVLLRSLSQAVYHPDNIGHFGLAYESYAHFTSPIRRYPDLLVHRAIRHKLQNKTSFIYDAEIMHKYGEHCSMTERRSDDATRDVVYWLKCHFMQDHLGSEFDGIITSVTNFGIFVELKDIYIEGLVHVTALENDYYQFDAVKHRLVGERTRKVYRLGDPIRVRVVRVDIDNRQIDFELA